VVEFRKSKDEQQSSRFPRNENGITKFYFNKKEGVYSLFFVLCIFALNAREE
jgi:hypothetical protein